jgi:hypothetical protein
MTGSGDVLRNFNADGLDSLYPRYAGGICRSSRWASGGRSRSSPSPRLLSTGCRSPRQSLAKLADFLVAEGIVEDLSHQRLRAPLQGEEHLLSGF